MNYLSKIPRTILLILCFLFIFGFFSVEIKDPDFWWHLKTGQYIYQMKSLPESDPFAYTSLPKDPINPESKRIKFILTQYWLAQVIFYWVYYLSGFQGIIYLRAALLTLLSLLIYKGIRREGAGLYFSLLLVAPIVLILHTFTGERPQLFSFLFSFLVIYLLEGFRKTVQVSMSLNESQQISGLRSQPTPKSSVFYLFTLPLIMLVWANLHGGFILGIAVILGYLFAETLKFVLWRSGRSLPARYFWMLVLSGTVSIILSLVNPNGYHSLTVLAEFEQSFYKKLIVESMSPVFLFQSGIRELYLIIFFLLLFMSVLVFLSNVKKIDLTDFVILAGLATMSLSSARFIPFFSPVAALMIARYGLKIFNKLARLESPIFMRQKIELPLSISLAIVLIIVINNADLFKTGVKANNYPSGVVRFLKENRISGNMFNPYVWGGYLMWELYPDYKVFIDGRGLIEEVFFQEVKIMEAHPKRMEGIPEWKAMLNAYNVNLIVTYSVGNFTGKLVPLVPALLNDPEWHLIYFDNISLIFVKDGAENSEIIKKYDLPKEWLWNEVAVEAALKARDYGNNISYYITEGDALFRKQSYIDAKTAYLRALQIDPKNSVVRKRLDLLRAAGY